MRSRLRQPPFQSDFVVKINDFVLFFVGMIDCHIFINQLDKVYNLAFKYRKSGPSEITLHINSMSLQCQTI